MTVQTISPDDVSVKLKAGSSFVKVRPQFSFDSKNILFGAGSIIKVISTASGECVRQLVGHPAPIVGLQTYPENHTQAISCSSDGTIITWDYMDGLSLRKYKIEGGSETSEVPVIAFYAPAKSKPMYFIQYRENDGTFGFELRCFNGSSKSSFILKNVVPNEHAVAFGAQAGFVADICDNKVRLYQLGKEKRQMQSYYAQSKFVCVACHPHEYVAATGDETGRVLVWSNIFDRQNVCRSVYHWHNLPLGDLCFSTEGFFMYSGGGECVLVKWNLQRESNEFLPRIGMPICQLVMSPDNTFLAVCHVDNAVSLVSSQMEVVKHIQGLSQGHPWSCPGQEVASTGLIHDPRTGALVMAGRPGTMQFYSLTNDKQLYSVDVVNQNFLSQERNKTIFYTQVEKADIDSTGVWMATLQRYDDGNTSPDIVLKVWKYNVELQTYSLNTTVILPHYQKVNFLRFRPIVQEEPPFFVTTSQDLKFKTWILQTTTEGATSIESWMCESRGHYLECCPSEASFKHDGSLMAVAFDSKITLWTPSPLLFKGVMFHPTSQSIIRQLYFGRESCSHLITSRSDTCLNVWDSMSKSMRWKAEIETTQLAADSLSEYCVAFSKDFTLFVFKPSSPEPCFRKTCVSTCDVIAASFMPQPSTQDNSVMLDWQLKSQLYYFNAKQELLTLVYAKEDVAVEDMQMDCQEENGTRVLPGTSFAALMARKKSTGVQATDILEHYTSRGIVGAKEVKELLEIPSHVLPPVRSFCCQFMSAFLIPKEVS